MQESKAVLLNLVNLMKTKFGDASLDLLKAQVDLQMTKLAQEEIVKRIQGFSYVELKCISQEINQLVEPQKKIASKAK